jgi:hypothetical protein
MLILFCLFLRPSFAQLSDSTYSVGIIFKLSPMPLLLEYGYAGIMEIKKDSIFVKPLPCTEADKKYVGIFYCMSHLIKPIAISFSDI